MSEYAKNLLELRANTWEQAKGLLDHAASEKRELTAEEEVSYGKMTADIESLRSRADKLVEDAASAKAAEDSLRSLMGKPATRETNDGLSDELRSFIKGEKRSVMLAPTLEEARALSKGTATAGGNAVPTSFYGSLWEHLVENATLMNGGATIFTTTSGESIEIPITTSHGAAAAVAEGVAIAGTDPAFAKRTLGSFKYGQLVKVSRELAEDAGFDLEGYLARTVGRNIGNAFGAKLVSGAGTTEPTGITVSSTLGVTGAAAVAGVPTLDNLIDLLYSVTSPYRDQSTAKWLMKDSTAAVIRKFREGAGTGAYLWQPSVIEGTPDRLLNKAVLTDPNVAGTGLSAKSVLFGDLSAYAVRVVNGIKFERSDEFAFDTDQITFRATIRGDGLLIDQTGAVKHFVGAAT
ncbi:phage major capsid protein [Cryobacterium sp. Sr8]|uniref:phage major capsid protein n=1 Tax=Cryobacterium sp. Sr8 TaxID=1259203 RepID=UPI00106941F7|nr:phage major capsid protein [Cryobacterium sp. Sr8]TFD80708.1 phage major capsid protein [Cryobacterium sp. Sr8]